MREIIGSERLIAFSDGVIAVIITIMVLELKPPSGADFDSLAHLAPTFLSFVLSFVYVAIYWTNHHHFANLVPHVNGAIMWANLHLLFWLSLIPFATAWMDEHDGAAIPIAAYGVVLLACALSWWLMQTVIVRAQGPNSAVRTAIGRDRKGRASPVIYLVGIVAAFYEPLVSYACYAAVAALWLIPDRRVEATLSSKR